MPRISADIGLSFLLVSPDVQDRRRVQEEIPD